MVVDQEEVLRLDIEMLELVLRVHQVEGFASLLHVAQQLFAGNARQAKRTALAEPVPEVAVGQLHDDEELAVDDVEAFERKNVGMAYGFDAGQGFEFLLGAVPILVSCLKIAVDELDRLVEAAGSLGLPNFAKAAPTQPLNEPVTGDGFGVAFNPHRHRPRPGGTWEGKSRGSRRAGTACAALSRRAGTLKPSFLQCESQTNLVVHA